MPEETRESEGWRCPYCGHLDSDAFEPFWGNSTDDSVLTECGNCEKKVSVTIHITHTYKAKGWQMPKFSPPHPFTDDLGELLDCWEDQQEGWHAVSAKPSGLCVYWLHQVGLLSKWVYMRQAPEAVLRRLVFLKEEGESK